MISEEALHAEHVEHQPQYYIIHFFWDLSLLIIIMNTVHGKHNGVAPQISSFDPEHHACEFLKHLTSSSIGLMWRAKVNCSQRARLLLR